MEQWLRRLDSAEDPKEPDVEAIGERTDLGVGEGGECNVISRTVDFSTESGATHDQRCREKRLLRWSSPLFPIPSTQVKKDSTEDSSRRLTTWPWTDPEGKAR